MKHLPKHLRQRWRYLGVGIEAWPDAEIDRGTFQRELWFAAGNLLGDPGSADADLTVYGFAFGDGRGDAVVRVRRDEVERGRAVVACLSSIGGGPVRTTVRGVAGTVRACEERYIRRPLEPTAQEPVADTDPSDGSAASLTAVVRGRRRDVRTAHGFVGATDFDDDTTNDAG